jgi:hypothetical protein
VVRVLKHLGSGLDEAAHQDPPAMIAPLNPDAAMEDWPSFCAEVGLRSLGRS